MNQLPLFDIDDEETRLRPVAPITKSRSGMFGAGKINRGFGGTLNRVGAFLSDAGTSFGGGTPSSMRSLLEREDEEQAEADWRAQVGGMGLSPEEASFAIANPDAFKEHLFKQGQAEKERDEMTSLFAGIEGMDPMTMALAKLNPQEFGKAAARDAGTAKTGTFYDTIRGKHVIEPTIEGGFLLEPDEDGNLVAQQRPKSWDEINEETRLAISRDVAGESARSNQVNEKIKGYEAETGRMNAETGARNSMKGTGDFTSPLVPRGEPPVDGARFDPGRFDGARVIPIGIGSRGEWVRGPNDGEMQHGIPTPAQNDLDLVDGKDADAVLKLERDELNKARTLQDMLMKRAQQANEFLTITQEGDKPFITGPPIWMASNHFPEFTSQWADPRNDSLRMLNKEMTIDMGQGMKGAFSDADRVFLQKGVPNVENREEANVAFAARQVAGANRASQYVSWLQNYERAFGAGTRRAAQAYWDDYAKANPVFDMNGKPKEKVPTITEWFKGDTSGSEPDPFKKPVSPAYTDAKAGKKNVAEASDDELMQALGLK